MVKIRNKIKISILANQLLTPKLASGGDVLCFEILSRIKNKPLEIYVPKIASDNIKSLLSGQNIYLSDETETIPRSGIIGGLTILWLYTTRTIKTTSLLFKNNTADRMYLTGDFFCNTVPAVIYKIFHPKSKIICNFFHLNPLPWKRENNVIFSSISWMLQHLSLALLRPYVNTIFVLTEEGKEILIKLGFNESILSISGAGVKKEFSDTAIKTRSQYQMLYVGRLNQTKGIYDAIKIIRLLREKYPQVTLGVIGSSSKGEIEKIMTLIHKHRLDNNIKCLGYVSDLEKINLMKTTPILLAPSHEEGFGIGVLEGIASGMTVVAYDLPVYKLVFDRYGDKVCYSPLGKVTIMAKETARLLKIKVPYNKPVKVPTWDDIAKIQLEAIDRLS